MAAPTRYPNGVTNVAKTDPLGMFGMPDPTKWHVYFNDFDQDIPSDWTETATSAGTGTSAAAVTDADGGVLRITTAANEDDGLFIESPGESFLIEAGKSFHQGPLPSRGRCTVRSYHRPAFDRHHALGRNPAVRVRFGRWIGGAVLQRGR